MMADLSSKGLNGISGDLAPESSVEEPSLTSTTTNDNSADNNSIVEVSDDKNNTANILARDSVLRNFEDKITASSHVNDLTFADGLPQCMVVDLKDLNENPPVFKEELIKGVLRRSSKMILSGPAKGSKSFVLLQCGAMFASGGTWLGMDFAKCRVLYINLEISEDSFISRIKAICEALNIESLSGNFITWNLRGCCKTLKELLPSIIERVQAYGCDVVIIDPIFKLLGGKTDENSASDMEAFIGLMDTISEKTDAACIFCHHYSKGSSGSKSMLDRASGSGVLARDPDTIVTLTPIRAEGLKDVDLEGRQPYRLEFTFRDFPNRDPINLFFEYPVHVLDEEHLLSGVPLEGCRGSKPGSKKPTTITNFLKAFIAAEHDGKALISEMAKHGISETTIRRYVVTELADMFMKAGPYITKR